MTQTYLRKMSQQDRKKQIVNQMLRDAGPQPGFWHEIDNKIELDELIHVMGLHDHRHDWVGVYHPDTERISHKSRDRPDQSRRYYISKANSEVGNWFEKKKYKDKFPTRQQQIDAYRLYVWNEWIQKGNIPDHARKWLQARAQEVNAGCKIDLVSEGHLFSRKSVGFLSKSQPYDCHGHVVRAVILILAGKIKADDFYIVQADYLQKMEGDRPDGIGLTAEEFRAADAVRAYETAAEPARPILVQHPFSE